MNRGLSNGMKYKEFWKRERKSIVLEERYVFVEAIKSP